MVKFLFIDSPIPWQLGFQDPATPLIIGIIHFYNYLIFFLVGIGVFVLWIIARALILFKNSQNSTKYQKVSTFSHSTPLEIVWTVVPAFLLVLIAGPSFALLYSFDESIAPDISIKVIGHQWFWSYEYSDVVHKETGKTICFDSYIIAEEDLSFGQFRLLETDNRLRLPTKRHIRVLVSAADVLHSWAVPSLGVKIDACPGRLNQVSLFLLRTGTFYGQCSELCGVNHAFMPIVVEALDNKDYQIWAFSNANEGGGEAEKVCPVKPLNNEEPFGPEVLESLSQIKEEKNLRDKQIQKSFIAFSKKYINILDTKCLPFPKVEFFGRAVTPKEKSLLLNEECTNVKVFFEFIHKPYYELKITRKSLCQTFLETYHETFLYNSKASEYFHKNDVSCETQSYLLGSDPVLLEVLDLEEKAYTNVKNLVEQVSFDFIFSDEIYKFERKKILGENYNYDGYFSKSKNKK